MCTMFITSVSSFQKNLSSFIWGSGGTPFIPPPFFLGGIASDWIPLSFLSHGGGGGLVEWFTVKIPFCAVLVIHVVEGVGGWVTSTSSIPWSWGGRGQYPPPATTSPQKSDLIWRDVFYPAIPNPTGGQIGIFWYFMVHW
jgi:hypothetical protein